MSFVHATTFAHVDAANSGEHNTKLICPTRNRNKLHQLMVCTQRFAQWFGGMDSPCVHYQDFAQWAWLCADMDPDLDDVIWIKGFSDPQGLERAFEPTFDHVEKKAYGSLAEWLFALRVATDKVPESERQKQVIRLSDIIIAEESREKDLDAMGYEGISYGEIRASGAKNEIVSFLEGAADGLRLYHESMLVLEYIFDACVSRGTCKDSDTDGAKKLALLNYIDGYLTLGAAFEFYHPVGLKRQGYIETFVEMAPSADDGTSDFAHQCTAGLCAVYAPTIWLVLNGARGQRDLNTKLIDVAYLLLSETMSTPARLFTVNGMTSLERAAATYSGWAAEGSTAELTHADRVAAFVAKLQHRITAGIGRGSSGSSGLGDGARDGAAGGAQILSAVGVRAAVAHAREQGASPGIIGDALVLLADPNHDPLDVMALLATGKTTLASKRRPTGLTLMIFYDLVAGTLVDQRFAAVKMYSRHMGGRYLGRCIGRRLVDNGLVLADNVTSLRFDALFEVLRDKEWGAHLNLYDLLLLPLIKQVQFAGTLDGTDVKPLPANMLYKDMLWNIRLPQLASWMFEAVGVPHSGDDSFRSVLTAANNFALFHGGITEASTRTTLGAISTLVVGMLSEAYQFHRPSLNPNNLDASVNDSFLRFTDAEGARGEFARTKAHLLRAAQDRRDRTFSEVMPTSVDAPGLNAFLVSPAKRSASDDASPADKRPKREARPKKEAGAGGDATTRDVVDAAHDYSGKKFGFADRGNIWYIGETRYDAKAAREEWGHDKCLPFLFSQGLTGAPDCCPRPGDPAHAADSDCHTRPEGTKGVSFFNIKRADNERRRSKGRGRGGGKGNRGGRP